MGFLTEPEPQRDVRQAVLPGIDRVVAANPGPMTYFGTNTYLIDTTEGLVVLDPGPDDAAHVSAVLRETGGEVALILISHTHHDHVGAAAALQEATGAPPRDFGSVRRRRSRRISAGGWRYDRGNVGNRYTGALLGPFVLCVQRAGREKSCSARIMSCRGRRVW